MTTATATLYVIPGSHACRTAMLALGHKGIDYRAVELITGLHPFIVRMHGFGGHRVPIRKVDGGTHRQLAILDRMGTVPALTLGDQRVHTNMAIIRFLDRYQPDPPLLPVDPASRTAVEVAERWGDETLQMAARRIVLAAGAHGLGSLHRRGNDGRLGALLSRHESVRLISSRTAGMTFRALAGNERRLLDELPPMLDRVDGWIAAGVLDGESLNAADLMIAPSLALLAYRLDLRPDIEARPAGALLRRVLPEPLTGAAADA
jgi:glutathione S-transferase